MYRFGIFAAIAACGNVFMVADTGGDTADASSSNAKALTNMNTVKVCERIPTAEDKPFMAYTLIGVITSIETRASKKTGEAYTVWLGEFMARRQQRKNEKGEVIQTSADFIAGVLNPPGNLGSLLGGKVLEACKGGASVEFAVEVWIKKPQNPSFSTYDHEIRPMIQAASSPKLAALQKFLDGSPQVKQIESKSETPVDKKGKGK